MITCKLPNQQVIHVGAWKWNLYHQVKKAFHRWTNYKFAMTGLDVEIQRLDRAKEAEDAYSIVSQPWIVGPKRPSFEIS
jgi:hypothetical protein